MGSDDSSTNPRCGNGDCGHLRSSHFNRDSDETAYCIGNRNLCPCDGFQLPVEQIHKWKPCVGCGHRQHSAKCRELTMPGAPGDVDECGCLRLTSAQEIKDRCMGAGGCPEHPTERQRKSCDHACTCGHAQEDHGSTNGFCNACGDDCDHDDGHYPSECPDGRTQQAPPLAPEEEEEAAWKFCPCGSYVAPHPFPGCEAPPPPPQPLRRPPYAVAYSIAGHLYEIALPGDATVHATDGGLIITHALGPVAGVVRVHPIEGEQS